MLLNEGEAAYHGARRPATVASRIVQQASEVIEMNIHHSRLGFVVFLSACSMMAQAADIEAGKGRAAVCQGCHGSAGVSSSPMWPSLAGQTAAYLESQLKKFKVGERTNATMNPMAEELSDSDIQNLAAYFASLPGKSAGGDKALVEQGKAKAAMCMGCHGEKLQGKGQFARLAGQQSSYLERQLKAFKNGERKAGPMNALAQSLDDEDIKALAAYLASL